MLKKTKLKIVKIAKAISFLVLSLFGIKAKEVEERVEEVIEIFEEQ